MAGRRGEPGDPSLEPELLPFGKGVPALARQLLWHLPYNDAARLEDVLRRDHDKIAAVLIEPILGSCCGIPATPEFMRAVRELCTRYDVLMVVDEVKTGFRVARGGAQQLHGLKADLCTTGQGHGQRLPHLGHRRARGRDASLPARRGHPRGHLHRGGMPLAAAERTLRILRDTDALERVAAYGRGCRKGSRRILGPRGFPTASPATRA